MDTLRMDTLTRRKTRSDLAAADRTTGRQLDAARGPAAMRRLITIRKGLRLMLESMK
jgi:hypothetical protein